MEAQLYLESVIQDAPIAKTIKKMCAKDKYACRILFNSAYYLAKQELFSDFHDLLILHLIEILLITPFSNEKLERIFSRMLRVKNDC